MRFGVVEGTVPGAGWSMRRLCGLDRETNHPGVIVQARCRGS